MSAAYAACYDPLLTSTNGRFIPRLEVASSFGIRPLFTRKRGHSPQACEGSY